MSDQVWAALITGGCAIIAAAVGLLRWRGTRRSGLLTPASSPPIFRAARHFRAAGTSMEQQQAIQQIEVALSHGSLLLSSYQMEQCAGSEYELDRIGLYLFEAYTAQPHHAMRVLHLRHEWERLRGQPAARAALPLLYALRSVTRLAHPHAPLPPALHESAEVLHEIARFVRADPALDPDREIAREAEKLLRIIERGAITRR